MKNKVLIISYYWPPKAGGGVHRWLKMSKFLPENDWIPVVYTPEMSLNALEDSSLCNEIHEETIVVRQPIWEPYDLYKKFTGKKKSEKIYSGFVEGKGGQSFSKKISLFIRGNFFIPDARMFWIRPSIKFLAKYCKENDIRHIISTGPPHSMHRIAFGVKKRLPQVKWIADFRDPWTNINFYDKLKTTKWADKRHKKLEKEVLENADKIVTVSWSWADDFQRLCGREDLKVITNGFDPTDFEGNIQVDNDKFTIIHVGSMNPDRNPIVLWQSLRELLKANESLKDSLCIKLIGVVDFQIIKSIEEFGLSEYLELEDYMPHKDVIAELRKSQVLLLPINTTRDSMGILPGKLYEYIGAKRPIFCICPEGSDAERVLEETNAGEIIYYEDEDKSYDVIEKWFALYQDKNLTIESCNNDKFSRRQLAKDYTDLLNQL